MFKTSTISTVKKIAPLVRLDGKTAIITGANTGIGKITAKDFYQRGARVILACRNLERAKNAVEDIKKECEGQQNTGELIVTELDLASFQSVRKWSTEILENENKINLLINNAGVMMCPKQITEDGNEMQFQTNHLGHFLLTMLLLPRIAKSTPARIVNVSSKAHEHRGAFVRLDDLNFENRRYSALDAYGQSKLANVLFTKELAKRIEEAQIKDLTTSSLHPGVIKTELGRHLDNTYFKGASFIAGLVFAPFRKTPEEGAETTIYCALDESVAKQNGLYYADCALKTPHEKARDVEMARKLWDVSWKLVGLDGNYNPFKLNE